MALATLGYLIDENEDQLVAAFQHIIDLCK